MRRTELDLCRIAGCLMVLIIHASAEIYGTMYPIDRGFGAMIFISSAVRGGVPIFFMLTGALVLTRQSLDINSVLKKHVLYLAGIFLLWSLVYALIKGLLGGSLGSAYDFVYTVISGHYHMWFIPAMLLCYIFIPPTHAAIHGVKLDERYLLGMFFGLVLLTSNMNLTPDTAPILYTITQHFSFEYLFYMGYVVWGWWLSTRKMPKSALWAAPIAFLAACLLAYWANRWRSEFLGYAYGWLFSYFSLPTFLQATALFCFFLSLRDVKFRHPAFIAALADCTLGVYLIHPMLISVFNRLGLEITKAAPVKELLIMCAALAVSGFVLVYLAKRIPFVKKLL